MTPVLVRNNIETTSRRDCFVYAGINSIAALVELAIGDRYEAALTLLLFVVVQLLIGLKLAPMTSFWWPAKAGGFLPLLSLALIAIIYGHFVRGSFYILTSTAGSLTYALTPLAAQVRCRTHAMSPRRKPTLRAIPCLFRRWKQHKPVRSFHSEKVIESHQC